MKNLIACICYCALISAGLALMIWALISWSINGFRFANKFSPIKSVADGYFFLSSIFIGLVLIGYAYYGLKGTLCKDGYSGRLRDIIPHQAYKNRHRNLVPTQGGMIYVDQHDAKKFFIEKVIAQANKESSPLSEAQKYMLGWTEVEEGFQINEKLNKKFSEETNDEDYKRRICALLEHVYAEDVAADPKMKETYRNAYRAMAKNDHYIHVMIREALGSKVKRWGVF
jgi:hypothetical protein